MEDGGRSTPWRFAAPNPTLAAAGERSIQKALLQVHACLDERGPRPVIPLSHGDPLLLTSFRTAPEAEEALVAAVRSGEYNGYPTPATGLPARRAVAEYLSRDLPYMISHDDIFLTCGGSQAIETVMSVFGQAGVNILLPMPGYPKHEAHAVFHKMEVRHYDLIPERGWEVDLEAVEALADGNTVAIVITNPNNHVAVCIPTNIWPRLLIHSEGFVSIISGPATFIQVKLDVSQFSDICDDVDFCSKLAKEESVILLPGKSLGMENWLRITFASEPPTLKQGLERVKSFCRRHQSQANLC
ncbi:nicotianamine aminotransferase A [Hordeum vulgare]|nr:nicotianamine aminotransferase A [Hordeum vulgare]